MHSLLARDPKAFWEIELNGNKESFPNLISIAGPFATTGGQNSVPVEIFEVKACLKCLSMYRNPHTERPGR